MAMDIGIHIMQALVWTLVAIVIFYGGTVLFDKLDPIDYHAEISKGNVAAAIKLGAVILALASIVVAAMVS